MNSTATKMRPMMEMYFHYRLEEYILFKEWLPTTTTGYVFSCTSLFVIALVIEALQHLRNFIYFVNDTKDICNAGCSAHPINGILPTENYECTCGSKNSRAKFADGKRKYTTRVHWLQTVLYFMHSFGIYTLMLVTMTYNIPLLICVIIGRAATFFVLRPLTPAQKGHDVCECCG